MQSDLDLMQRYAGPAYTEVLTATGVPAMSMSDKDPAPSTSHTALADIPGVLSISRSNYSQVDSYDWARMVIQPQCPLTLGWLSSLAQAVTLGTHTPGDLAILRLETFAWRLSIHLTKPAKRVLMVGEPFVSDPSKRWTHLSVKLCALLPPKREHSCNVLTVSLAVDPDRVGEEVSSFLFMVRQLLQRLIGADFEALMWYEKLLEEARA